MAEPTVYELSSAGRIGVRFPEPDVPLAKLPAGLERETLPLPELSELDVVRHFTHLSQLNYSIDGGYYPLGSCTMKYNPKINEETARLPGFAFTHPLQPAETVQGNLALMYELQEYLKEISGFAAVSLQPAAGAHGEFTGVMIIKAYHDAMGHTNRTKMLIPDSAHGTNPATSAMRGFEVVGVPSDSRGNVDLTALKALCDDTVAGLMLTNPNTLGLFEEHVVEVLDLIHGCGGLVYGDGANLNALLGIARPGDIGFDVMHFNLHKTFSTPHGGGGPGAGPVGVAGRLLPFMPIPLVLNENGFCRLATETDLPQSIGRLSANMGNAGVLMRAYVYARLLGGTGMQRVAEYATLNANYLMVKLREAGFELAFPTRRASHEFIVTLKKLKDATGVSAMDFAKRLLDYGYHAPTTYFPMLVPECLLIEPTETESRETLDGFIETMKTIKHEAETTPDLVKGAPYSLPVRRLDDVKAARELDLAYPPGEFSGA